MTIKELLNQAVIMLKNENISAPKTKARMLLQATLKKPREYLVIYDNKEIDKKQFENLCGLQCTKSEICSFFGVTDKTLLLY